MEHNRLHICMITQEFPPKGGGIGYYVLNLSKKLVERGHQVTVLTRGSAKKTEEAIVQGINLFRIRFLPFYPFHVWIHGFFVKKVFRNLEPKLALVHLHSPIIPPIETCHPVMLTVHTATQIEAKYHKFYDPYFVMGSLFFPRMESKLLSISTKITAVSNTVAEEISRYETEPKRIIVVGNGVDEKIFAPPRERRQTEKYVLYTGLLQGRKGLFDLIECAKYVCQSYPRIKFLIVGKGPLLSFLKERVRRMSLQGNITFLGYLRRDMLVKIYQNAYVQVIPSHYEGLPTVLLEAMSCGVPVVATSVGGNREVLSSGLNGFLVPPRAPQEMSEAIMKLLNDPQLREDMGKESRKTVETHYTWDKITERFLRCYHDIT